jgi:hypothetical protein
MNHSFDIEHAQSYGIPEAVLISNFQHWITKNRANGTHFHDGRTWTYNTVKAFAELFPYLSIKQVRRALGHLLDASVLVKGDHNKVPTNHTLWYAFFDESRFLIGQTELPKRANRIAPEGNSCFAPEGKSTNRTDITADSKHTDATPSAAVKFSPLPFLIAQGVDHQVATDWLAVCKGLRKVVTQTKLDEFQTEITRAGMTWDAVIRLCCSRNWVSFNADWAGDRRSTSRALAAPGPGQSGMSAKTAATVANLNAYFGEQS